MEHPGSENLIPLSSRSSDELREMRVKGGINSGIARRRKKTYMELAEIIGTQKVSEENGRKLKKLGLTNGDQTNDALAVARIFLGAQQGNPKMTELWLKLRGEMPKEESNVNMTVSEGNQVIAYVPDDGREPHGDN